MTVKIGLTVFWRSHRQKLELGLKVCVHVKYFVDNEEMVL